MFEQKIDKFQSTALNLKAREKTALKPAVLPGLISNLGLDTKKFYMKWFEWIKLASERWVNEMADKQASRNMARKAASAWWECSAYDCAIVEQLLISHVVNNHINLNSMLSRIRLTIG